MNKLDKKKKKAVIAKMKLKEPKPKQENKPSKEVVNMAFTQPPMRTLKY